MNINVKTILNIFKKNGYEIYLVGGCVRDYLLNYPIQDYDLTTSATPIQMQELAIKYNIKYIPTGIKHGTITFVLNHEHFEITTFRKESEYEKNRFPKQVEYTTHLKEDIQRRDFTMNAIALNEDGIIDYYNGEQDIKDKIIRAIGDPDIRFHEDALRILRCLRFHFTYHFKIEKNTYEAIQRNAHLLKNISKERIRDELVKMLKSNAKDLLITLKETGVLPYMIEEMVFTYNVTQETPYHIYDVFHHTNEAFNSTINNSITTRLAILLHDVEKVHYKTKDDQGIAHFKKHAHASAITAKKALERLHFEKSIIQRVYSLIDLHDYRLEPNEKHIRKFLYKVQGNFDLAYEILYVQMYDNMGKNPAIIKDKNSKIKNVIEMIQEMEKKKECYTIKELNVNGNDMASLGYRGKEIGVILDYLLKDVVQNQQHNNKPFLMKLANGGIKNEIINRE